MKFVEYLETLPKLQEYKVEIILSTWETMHIQNRDWKRWSLQLLQNHLAGQIESTQKFPLEQFCENYEAWKQEPQGHHTTIAFLDRYNREWGRIKKIT